MANITEMLNQPSLISNDTRECALSIDCQEISCITEYEYGGYQMFELVLLPCVTPPAVRIVLYGEVDYDHTFYQSEEDPIHPWFNRGTVSVTLDHLYNNSIGLQVNILYLYMDEDKL